MLRGTRNLRTVVRDAWAELYHIWGGHRANIDACQISFRFRAAMWCRIFRIFPL